VEKPSESPEAMFQRTLHMDVRLAQTLTAGGIVTLEELAYIPIAELLGVQGLEEPEAQLFRKRARAYLLVDPMGSEDDGDPVDA
jgi:N utilization substance protein A